MTAPTFLKGNALLEAVSESLGGLHERYHQRRPVTVKTQLMDGELLACVMGGVYTEVEQTMIELQRRTVVQETRSAFQAAMQHRFIGEVERLTGRRVVAFISSSHVGPDLEVELFLLGADLEP